MALQVTVPISTAVIEANPECPSSGAYEDGVLRITIDTRHQHVPQRLGLSTKTQLHWGKEQVVEVQELSALAWPIRDRVLTRDGYYLPDGQRVHFTTAARGLDARRGVSAVLMRAAVLRVVVAGVGCRRAAWLLEQLFHGQTAKSALPRWVEESAATLPNAEAMRRTLHPQRPITEAHGDELVPRGSDIWVLVLKDEHGRILATQEVDQRDEQTVVPFLQQLQGLGIELQAFSIDGCKAYDNAIRTVFGPAGAMQSDYFPILQNVWRHLWKWAGTRRRQLKARSQEVLTPWDKKKLEAVAQSLGEQRSLLFKAAERMTAEEQQPLAERVEAEQHVGMLRACLGGVWHIFEDSQDEQQARAAVAALKQLPVDRRHPAPFQKVITCLEAHFEWMTAYLRHEGVQRNSLAESGMRVLRRLEVEHDGFRSATGRSNCLRIYQAVKYLGWTVHRSPVLETKST